MLFITHNQVYNNMSKWSRVKYLNANSFSGRWDKGVSAGGSRMFPDTFHLNPQFRISLQQQQSDQDEEDGDGCSIVLGLMQKPQRKSPKQQRHHLTIGFSGILWDCLLVLVPFHVPKQPFCQSSSHYPIGTGVDISD